MGVALSARKSCIIRIIFSIRKNTINSVTLRELLLQYYVISGSITPNHLAGFDVTYLKIMLAAFNGAGKSKAQISREAGLNDLTLRHYMRGDYIVPAHRRKKLDLVFGEPIDWPAYEAEFAAAKAAKVPAAPPAPAPKVPEAPKRPAKAPQAPVRAPAPAPKTQKPPVPPEKPPVRRFFGIPIIDDSNEATA